MYLHNQHVYISDYDSEVEANGRHVCLVKALNPVGQACYSGVKSTTNNCLVQVYIPIQDYRLSTRQASPLNRSKA